MKKENENSQEKHENRKKRKKIYNIFLAFFVLIFLISGYFLLEDIIPRIKASKEMSEIQKSSPEVDDPNKPPSLAELKAINPDIVGWIYIENTNINFPLLQCSNNVYYLSRTYTEEYNDAGSIFLDYHNTSDFSDQNTVIYGHARKNGTMFAQLGKYKKQSGYDESPFIRIVTENKIYYYQIFSANILEATYDYRDPDYGNNFMSFVRSMRNNSKIKSNAVVSENSKIITLSTCTTVINDGRLVIFAVLLNPEGEMIDLNQYQK